MACFALYTGNAPVAATRVLNPVQAIVVACAAVALLAESMSVATTLSMTTTKLDQKLSYRDPFPAAVAVRPAEVQSHRWRHAWPQWGGIQLAIRSLPALEEPTNEPNRFVAVKHSGISFRMLLAVLALATVAPPIENL